MKKIEIIIDKSYLRNLLEKFDKIGIVGYSVLDVVKGKGKMNNETIDGGILATNAYIISLCAETLIDEVKKSVATLINETGGLFLISTPEYIVVK